MASLALALMVDPKFPKPPRAHARAQIALSPVSQFF
jgi:hypothetical protein